MKIWRFSWILLSTIVYLLLSEKSEVTRGRFLVKAKRSRYAARLAMKTSVRWKLAVDENMKGFYDQY